jgi:YidC/Oxa1 family membrane protein insertase
MAQPTQKKHSNLIQFFLIFLLVYFGTQLFFGNQQNAPQPTPGLRLEAVTSSLTIGHHPVLSVTNVPATSISKGPLGWIQSMLCGIGRTFGSQKSEHECREFAATETGETATVQTRCPSPPVDLYRVENPGETPERLTPVTSTETAVPCETVSALEAGDTVKLSLAPWKYSLFERTGTFEARLPGAGSDAVAPTTVSGATIAPPPVITRFTISEPGVFTKLYRTFIAAPLLNLLVLIASFVPAHDLAIAIILLTIAIKLLLFLPTQHALEGQKKMQMLQPKLQELQKKYEGDKTRIQEETMKLWKEHKINPFSSCLPMLLQFPILIGLYTTIRDGSTLALSRHLFYGPYQDLSWHFDTHFLGLDLVKPEVFLFPITLVVLQFLQMKLTFAIQKRKTKKKDAVIDVGAKSKAEPSAQDMQQKMMLYVLPLMIGFFAFQSPAAVALYWGVSTLFGIGQQILVNREHLRV